MGCLSDRAEARSMAAALFYRAWRITGLILPRSGAQKAGAGPKAC